MNNNDVTRELFNRLLSESIRNANFNKLTVERLGEDKISMMLDGEAHGLIGAITSVIQAISESAGIPIELILQMISSYNECLGMKRISSSGLNETASDVSSLVDLFGKFIDDVKKEDKEGEN